MAALSSSAASEVEETLSRISSHKGVEGVIILSRDGTYVYVRKWCKVCPEHTFILQYWTGIVDITSAAPNFELSLDCCSLTQLHCRFGCSHLASLSPSYFILYYRIVAALSPYHTIYTTHVQPHIQVQRSNPHWVRNRLRPTPRCCRLSRAKLPCWWKRWIPRTNYLFCELGPRIAKLWWRPTRNISSLWFKILTSNHRLDYALGSVARAGQGTTSIDCQCKIAFTQEESVFVTIRSGHR
jgi:hypothetical protein